MTNINSLNEYRTKQLYQYLQGCPIDDDFVKWVAKLKREQVFNSEINLYRAFIVDKRPIKLGETIDIPVKDNHVFMATSDRLTNAIYACSSYNSDLFRSLEDKILVCVEVINPYILLSMHQLLWCISQQPYLIENTRSSDSCRGIRLITNEREYIVRSIHCNGKPIKGKVFKVIDDPDWLNKRNTNGYRQLENLT